MRLGVVSRLSLSRKGLCALLASSKSCSMVFETAGIPEDVDILRKAQPEVLLLHASGEPAEFENVSRLRNLAARNQGALFSETWPMMRSKFKPFGRAAADAAPMPPTWRRSSRRWAQSPRVKFG